MNETPRPAAPPPGGRKPAELIEALQQLLPIVALAATIPFIFLAPIPPANREIAVAIVSGLLGHLTARRGKGAGR
jgi:hypothetical protein